MDGQSEGWLGECGTKESFAVTGANRGNVTKKGDYRKKTRRSNKEGAIWEVSKEQRNAKKRRLSEASCMAPQKEKKGIMDELVIIRVRKVWPVMKKF